MDKLLERILHTDDAMIALVSENIYKAYFILFLIIMLETGLILFPFLPGDGLLFSAGVVASTTDLNVWVLIVILTVAAVLGNVINYAIGTSLGTKLNRSKNTFIRNYLMNYLPRAQQFYDNYGGRAIILGRFFRVIRTYLPFVAGIVKMERTLFLKNTVVGAIFWINFFILTGFFVGQITWVKNNYGIIFIGLILITLLPLLVAALKRNS